MNAPPAALAVDPSAMLTLVIDTPNGPRGINAINCRYVPAWVNPQLRVVAVEVIHDPFNPIPVQAYFCDPDHLRTELFPADALRHVRPYRVPPVGQVPPGVPPPNPNDWVQIQWGRLFISARQGAGRTSLLDCATSSG
jgi:hypothetical protein